MMMQMIEAGGIVALTDNQRTADDDNPKGYFELEAVKKTKNDPSWLEAAIGKAAKVIYLLLYDLPNQYEYRVVFMNRRIEEVLASQSRMLARRGEKGANVNNEQMSKIFKSQLDKSHAWLKEQDNFSVHYVNYHDVIDDPAGQANAIANFLGGAMNVNEMASVVTDQLYRQRT